MRPPKVTDDQLLPGLMSVLQAKGYAGASLNELAAAAGLQKASLYHRFPGGKQAITEAVLDYVKQWLEVSLVAVLTNKALQPKDRLEKALENIDALYGQGQKTCILRALSMDSGLEVFGKHIAQHMNTWIRAFADLGLDLEWSEEKALAVARQTLVLVQGSLIVAKGLSDLSPFHQALSDIRNLYRA